MDHDSRVVEGLDLEHILVGDGGEPLLAAVRLDERVHRHPMNHGRLSWGR